MSFLYRLTPQRLGDILAVEPKAEARFDANMRVIGVDLPLPDGMTHGDGSRAKTALFGDRVGQDQYGHWIVTRATP